MKYHAVKKRKSELYFFCVRRLDVWFPEFSVVFLTAPSPKIQYLFFLSFCLLIGEMNVLTAATRTKIGNRGLDTIVLELFQI